MEICEIGEAMTKLDQAWWAWRALSKAERAQFLVLLREAYGRERAAAVRKRGNAAHGRKVFCLAELTLADEDLRRLQ
ncbi:hypothetical protein ACVWXO_006965 [Bradyrhizobium sp. LM2.7]